ncbi:MAG TPA: alpha/beta hydrolase [Acidimicrobiia bacterium]|jgi:pimeloyl-ACP methyl ester carboxylesterase
MKTFQSDTGATLRYGDVGHGRCVLVIHGAYSTHHEIASAFEPMVGAHNAYRRLYPDLPGMGASPPHDSIQSSSDVVDLLDHFVDEVVGQSPLLVIGHSYGAHLARGLAVRRPRQVAGLALICPLMPNAMNPEPHAVVQSDVDPAALLDPSYVDEYLGYFVVHTGETVQRFNEAVVPSIGRFDGVAVERIMTEWRLDPDPDEAELDAATLIVTGRHDSVVGYREQVALIDRYPRASYVVLADGGHALPHERPEVLTALIGDWLASSMASVSEDANSA